MKQLPTYNEFLLNESLVILSLKGLMKNEFMNNIELKKDYEDAKRLFFDFGSFLFSHVEGEEFTLRTFSNVEASDLDAIVTKVNDELSRMKFKRIGPSKKSILKENVWKLKASLS